MLLAIGRLLSYFCILTGVRFCKKNFSTLSGLLSAFVVGCLSSTLLNYFAFCSFLSGWLVDNYFFFSSSFSDLPSTFVVGCLTSTLLNYFAFCSFLSGWLADDYLFPFTSLPFWSNSSVFLLSKIFVIMFLLLLPL